MLYEEYIDPEFRLKINPETGKVANNKIIRKITKEEFIMVFLKTIPDLFCLQGNELKLLMLLWQYSRYNAEYDTQGNIFSNDTLFKNWVRNKGMELSNSAIDVYISSLAKRNVILKKGKGCYLLNPKYFFKGTIDDSSKLALIFSNYNIKDEIK